MCLLPLIFVPSFQGPSGRAPFPDLAAQFDENGCDDGFVNVEAMPGGPVWRFAVPCAAFRGAADDVVDERPASGTPR